MEENKIKELFSNDQKIKNEKEKVTSEIVNKL